ncbi:MAG: hypothetical protein C4560_07035 [Nitrospiraceae bacterium]|nr:MAG: hypothetical protein C4560_07035 [Nitrospiraceae bacterium]
MLKILHTNKLFTFVILTAVTAMIIVTFIFWGIGPKDRDPSAVVAQVGDKKISIDEYWRAYDNEYKRIRETVPNEEEMKKLNLQDRVLNSMIDRNVLLFAADNAGIKVTEEELQEAIVKMPYFQRNGVFDETVYARALKLSRLTPQAFEAGLKSDLILNKMTRLIAETSELTPEEMKLLDTLGGGNLEQIQQLLEIFRSNKSSIAITAYVESLKRGMKISVNKDVLS